MATVNVYIDGTTLSNSTAVYTDAGLTTCATAGFYSDGTISREQVVDAAGKCSLLPNQTCPSCATACGGLITFGTANSGYFILDIDTGATSIDTGAIVVRFNPDSIPDGIKAVYNGVTYNKLSSPVYGKLQSTGANDPFTFIGQSSFDCGILAGSPYTLDEYEYDGTSFVATGGTQGVTVNSVDMQLTAAQPQPSFMVIPKLTGTPSIIRLEIAAPCTTGTSFSITVNCPTELTSFEVSSRQVSSANACAETIYPVTLYNVAVTGTAGAPALHDYVFTDANGQFAPGDGFYRVATTGDNIEVTDGIVVGVNTCP